MQTYAKQVIDFVLKNKTVTHKDMANITGANCSYSVLRAVKKKVQLIEEWAKNPNNNKRFKRYFLAS